MEELSKDVLATQSSVDDAWDALSDYEKIQLMTKHTKEFNLTNHKLNTMLLKLPFTEQEINTAYAVNNGGGVIFKTKEGKTKDKTKARIDKFLEDGTAEIIRLSLDGAQIMAYHEIVNIEDYVVDTHDAVNADMFTRYTIYKARCEELGYSVDIAKEQLMKDFNDTFNENNEKEEGDTLFNWYILRAYVNGFAMTDIAEKLLDGEPFEELYHRTDSQMDMYLDTAEEWKEMRDGIAEVLLYNEDLDVTTWGYDVLPYRNVKALKEWMANNFEKNGILYSAGKRNNIKICGQAIDLDDYTFRRLIPKINKILASCRRGLIIVYNAEGPQDSMWVKLSKL